MLPRATNNTPGAIAAPLDIGFDRHRVPEITASTPDLCAISHLVRDEIISSRIPYRVNKVSL